MDIMRIARFIVLSVGTALFIAIIALWVRSYWVADSWHWSDVHRDHCVALSGGRLIYLTADWPNGRVELPVEHSTTRRVPTMPWWDEIERFNRPRERWLILHRVRDVYPYPPQQMFLSFYMPTWDVWWVPVWPLVLISSIVPTVGLSRWYRKRRRLRRGLCHECGYDLRESGERCPECGTMRVTGGTRAEVVAVAHGGRGV